MEIKQIVIEIQKHRKRIAVERDALDKFIGELTGLRESCNKAFDSLIEAVDDLSELV